ncbi:MAG: T9SS type A sorting domain-containing protein [Flavobacteriaceae bacterium]
MKKTLLILLFLFSITAFAQDVEKTTLAKINLDKISASPNPFNEKTTIFYNSSSKANVNFIVQDLLGNIIHTEKVVTIKGRNSIVFYRNNLTAGVYIYNLKTKNKIISKRFVIK